MRLARLLRGAASAGLSPRLRAAGLGVTRSLSSDSGTGPESERGVPGQVDFYARFSPSPLSMKQFLDFGECGPELQRLSWLSPEAHPSSSAGRLIVESKPAGPRNDLPPPGARVQVRARPNPFRGRGHPRESRLDSAQ
ncbi:hypothetical protein P7K49_013976 [Saguinus oedipus]|uniref:Uncharacterized protein n=1 Tax=Saguinus oedipus TaxID=9490 RepID=A0ABQ9VHK7_SAGOE|nr:hypothetical protein P7K49_013976 [Saguinus oedipus]